MLYWVIHVINNMDLNTVTICYRLLLAKSASMALLRRLSSHTFSACTRQLAYMSPRHQSAGLLTVKHVEGTLCLQWPHLCTLPTAVAGISVRRMSHHRDSASVQKVREIEDESAVGGDETKDTPNASRSAKDLLASQILKNLSAEESKELRRLQVEYHMWQSMGFRNLPSVVTDEQWLELLKKQGGERTRQKLYSYWSKMEVRKRQAERKKKRRIEERKAAEAMEGPEYHPAGIDGKNTYLLMVRGDTMVKHSYNNLAYAACHGIPLVFDLAFDYGEREAAFVARQIKVAHGDNKKAQEPFHLHFTGLRPGSQIHEQLQRYMAEFERIPYTASPDSYLEHYPKDRLVYLSPNAPTLLKRFNPNDVYIVGGIVDIYSEKPITYAKAKKENIRMASFPLDLYLK